MKFMGCENGGGLGTQSDSGSKLPFGLFLFLFFMQDPLPDMSRTSYYAGCHRIKNSLMHLELHTLIRNIT